MHVFLTGDRGIGKSWAAASAAALLQRPCLGFRTAFLAKDHRASALYLFPAGADCPSPEARVAAVWADGRLTAVAGVFDKYGTALLREARRHPEALILMDECGHVERDALVFQREILACLDGETPVLGVLRKGQLWHGMIREHPNVRVLEVTAQNRGRLPQQIAALIRGLRP